MKDMKGGTQETPQLVPTIRGSNEAPHKPMPKCLVRLPLTPKIDTILSEEIKRLQQHAIICRVLGKRPNMGELRDLIQLWSLKPILVPRAHIPRLLGLLKEKIAMAILEPSSAPYSNW